MSIALIPVLPNNVLDKVFEYLPPNDVHVKVYHEKHWCALEPSEYTYILPYGTTIYELKQKLLYDEFEKYGWESDELILMANPMCAPRRRLRAKRRLYVRTAAL